MKGKAMKYFYATLIILGLAVAANASGKSDNSSEKSQHVDAWHGTGSNHQGNNNPGDTASDRHNFDDATAGGSGKNPPADE